MTDRPMASNVELRKLEDLVNVKTNLEAMSGFLWFRPKVAGNVASLIQENLKTVSSTMEDRDVDFVDFNLLQRLLKISRNLTNPEATRIRLEADSYKCLDRLIMAEFRRLGQCGFFDG